MSLDYHQGKSIAKANGLYMFYDRYNKLKHIGNSNSQKGLYQAILERFKYKPSHLKDIVKIKWQVYNGINV